MRNKISTFTFALFLAGTILTSCQSSSEKVKNAQEDVQEAKMQVTEAQQDLNQALQDSIQQFKTETNLVISANEKRIAAFKLKIENGNKATKAKYEKAVAELEQKNSELKMKLEEYKEEGDNKWQKFKSEFKSDMNKLGKAISDLTVDNVK